MPLTDQPGHELGIAEVSGTQRSPDPLWDGSQITYWGVTDLLGDQGTQRGITGQQAVQLRAPESSEGDSGDR